MNNALWNSRELAGATGGIATGAWEVCGVSIDNRTMAPGELFVAIAGEHHDGHDHAEVALRKGAGGLLLSHPVAGLAAAAPIVMVADSMKALESLAHASRKRSSAKIIGVTGSVGKTTAKEMLHHIGDAQIKTHATLGNLNNHIGMPLTLARMPQATELGVFELGMNHPNEIAPLVNILRPHIALITTVGTAHIENFADGQSGITKAKAEIFAHMAEDGIAILPRDNDEFALLHSEAQRYGVKNILTFGAAEGVDARLVNIKLHPDSSDITASIRGQNVSYTLPLPGEHMAMNSVAALLAAQAAGLDVARAAHSLASFTPLKGRGVKKVFGDITVIDESYNASPLSMTAAIKVLAQTPATRRIAVLGQMNELGATAPEAHATLAADLSAAKVDLVFCCGDHMQHLWKKLAQPQQGAWAPDAAALAPLVASQVKPGDTVLVKGSRGEQVNIKGVMSPTMMQVIAAIEAAQPVKEMKPHVA